MNLEQASTSLTVLEPCNVNGLIVAPSTLPRQSADKQASIPSVTSFLSVESDRTTALSTFRSSPALTSTSVDRMVPQRRGSFSENDRDVKTADSGMSWAEGDEEEADAVSYEDDEEDGELSDVSVLFSSSTANGGPRRTSSSTNESFEPDINFQSLSDLDTPTADASRKDEWEYETKKRKSGHKRKISSWYQKRIKKRSRKIKESLVKSYRTKVNQFKKIFNDTPVDTDRLLVDYSCALAKNKNGLLLQGRMYITEKWICFYSKIIYEQKLHLAVSDIQSVTKAKTARLIPNAIQLTLLQNSERYFFTSFASRERTFAILKKVCENNKAGSVVNMEDLLCQVQDVYGDESLAVLDFEECDDFEDDLYTSNRPDRSSGASSSSDLIEMTPSPCAGNPRLPNSFEPPTATANTTPTGLSARKPSKHSAPASAPTTVAGSSRRRRYRSRDEWRTDTAAANVDGKTVIGDDYEGADAGDVKAMSPVKHSISTSVFSECDTTTTTSTTNSSGGTTSDEENGGDLEKNPSMSKSQPRRKNAIAATSIDSVARPNRKTNVAPVAPLLPTVKATNSEPITAASENDEDADDAPVSCGDGHEHPGRMYADTAINLSVDALFACLFTNSQFFANFCAHRSTFDVEQSRWPPRPWPTGDALFHRKISYTLTLKQRLGPRTCTAVENQTILLRETRPGMRYVIDAKVTNEAVPLCNCFHVTSRYCLLRRSATVSHLKIYSEVMYDRPVFFGAKSIIESTCRASLTENFTDLVDQLAAAVMRLSEPDKATGGALARPFRRPAPPQPIGNTKSPLPSPQSLSSDLVPNATSNNTTSAVIDGQQKAKMRWRPGTSLPNAEFNFMQQNDQHSDKNWLLIIAASLLMCFFLSLIYNRHQQLELMAGQRIDITDRRFGSSSSAATCPDEVESLRLLVKSVSTVLNQIQKTLELLERRLDRIDEVSCVSPSRAPFVGQ